MKGDYLGFHCGCEGYQDRGTCIWIKDLHVGHSLDFLVFTKCGAKVKGGP